MAGGKSWCPGCSFGLTTVRPGECPCTPTQTRGWGSPRGGSGALGIFWPPAGVFSILCSGTAMGPASGSASEPGGTRLW